MQDLRPLRDSVWGDQSQRSLLWISTSCMMSHVVRDLRRSSKPVVGVFVFGSVTSSVCFSPSSRGRLCHADSLSARVTVSLSLTVICAVRRPRVRLGPRGRQAAAPRIHRKHESCCAAPLFRRSRQSAINKEESKIAMRTHHGMQITRAVLFSVCFVWMKTAKITSEWRQKWNDDGGNDLNIESTTINLAMFSIIAASEFSVTWKVPPASAARPFAKQGFEHFHWSTSAKHICWQWTHRDQVTDTVMLSCHGGNNNNVAIYNYCGCTREEKNSTGGNKTNLKLS